MEERTATDVTAPEPVTSSDRRATADAGFVALYDAEVEPMTRLAFLLTGSNALAQDLVHDAFIKVRPRLEGVDNPGGYLRTAVVNECRMWLRRRRLERSHAHAETIDVPPEVDHLWHVLQRLPVRQRTAVVLRYYLDLPTAQIAELLDCRPSTARSLIHRGLEAMREELHDAS